ncbi:hypothetical protein [Bacteroides sp. 519]|uniref:hypothetical protein n=1 Tax=Bacteroides sp. 519 TaxID=2302937 RepID=UPI0013CFC951|nr:hypothetical protein [Bacteroides sp. 519]
MQNIKKIEDLKAYHNQKQQIEMAETKLAKALLTDMNDLKLLYDIFIYVEEMPTERLDIYEYKKMFMVIAFLFFAPQVLAGQKIPYGMRGPLKNVLEVCDGFVSRSKKDKIFLYSENERFRETIDAIYDKMYVLLQAQGKL